MATINFPANPQLNDTYTFLGRTWIYNGIGWVVKPDDITAFVNKGGDTMSGKLTITSGGLSVSGTTSLEAIETSSQTLVDNLNADFLDGQEGAFYRNASNLNAGTLALLYGGTGSTTAAGARTNLGAAALAGSSTQDFSTQNLTVSGTTYNMLTLSRTTANGASILFQNSSGNLGKLGFDGSGNLIVGKGTTTDGAADLLKITPAGVTTFYNSINGTSGNFSNILTASSLGIGTVSPTAKIEILNTTEGEYNFAFRAMVSDLLANQSIIFQMGKSSTSKNRGSWYYKHFADGSNSNRMSFGFIDVDDIFNMFASGNISIGTLTDSGNKLNVNGTILASSFIKSGGTASQFLKADGTVDSNAYLPLTGGTITGNTTIKGGTNVFEYTLRLAKGNYADTGGHTTLIGFGVETVGWSKSAIGHTRTGSYDRGYLGFYINNSIDTTSATSSDLKMSIDSSGLVWSNGGFSKQGSSDSYVLLGAGGHKLISDFTDDDRNKGVNNVTTLTSLPISKRLIYATVTAATSISLSSAMEVGSELHIVVYNSSAAAVTQVLPNTGAFVSMSGSSISIPSVGHVEINILCHATGSYIIRAGGVSW